MKEHQIKETVKKQKEGESEWEKKTRREQKSGEELDGAD